MRVTGQVSESRLRHLLRELGRAHLAKGGGIDQVQVAIDERGEGLFGSIPRVLSQQFQVGGHHLQVYRRHRPESDNISARRPQPVNRISFVSGCPQFW